MAVDPIKIQTVLRKASDQQLMALLKRPDSIPSMFVQQELRRRNQARQAAKADMSKMAMAQRPQLTPEMSRMDQPPMPQPNPQMANAVPMSEGGSGKLARDKQLLMQMYQAGRMNIVQGVAKNDKGELGNFARSLLGGASEPEEAMGLNLQGARPSEDNSKSDFLNQLEGAGIKAIESETSPMDLENEFIEGQFNPEGKFDYGVVKEGYKPTMPNAAGREDIYLDTPLNTFPFREEVVEPKTTIDAVRPNTPYTTTLDRTAIPQGPDFAEQKFQQASPSGYKGDPRLALNRSPSALSGIVNAINNPPPDSGRFLATNRGDLDQARDLIKGESGFGNISSTSGLEVPDSSGKAPINDIFKGIANMGGEPPNPVSQGGITSDRFLMENDVMTPQYMDYLSKKNRANKKIADSIKTDNALFTEKGYTRPPLSPSASYLPDDRRIIPKGPDFAEQKFKRGMPTGNFEESGYAQAPILPDGTSRSLDAYNAIKAEIAEGLDNEFLGAEVFNFPEPRTARKNILGIGAGLDEDLFRAGGNLTQKFNVDTPVKEVIPSNKRIPVVNKEEEKIIEKVTTNTTTPEVDYTQPFVGTDKANMDNAFMDENGKPLKAGDALKKQYQNSLEADKVKKDGSKVGGVGNAVASQYGALTDAQNKLIEAMKPNGGDRFWELVASFGANLAASDSPNFMQAAGQAMQQTLAEAKDMKKEDRQMLIDQAKVAVDLEFKRAELGLQLAKINASGSGSGNSVALLRLQEQINQNNIKNQFNRETLEMRKEGLVQDYEKGLKESNEYIDNPEGLQAAVDAYRARIGGGSGAPTIAIDNTDPLDI